MEQVDIDISRSEELANRLDEYLANEKAADVMFALGILIGRAVETKSTDNDLPRTMQILTELAATEIAEIKQKRLVG